MRIVRYNILDGGEGRADPLAEVIEAQRPDLVALVEATDAMLKAANVELAGPMTQVGNALVTAAVVGDVAAVKAATDAGAQAVKAIKGDLVSVHVIARPHADTDQILPRKK